MGSGRWRPRAKGHSAAIEHGVNPKRTPSTGVRDSRAAGQSDGWGRDLRLPLRGHCSPPRGAKDRHTGQLPTDVYLKDRSAGAGRATAAPAAGSEPGRAGPADEARAAPRRLASRLLREAGGWASGVAGAWAG